MLAAGIAPPWRRDGEMALPHQPSRRNVAKHQLESPPPPFLPRLPLQGQEEDAQEGALSGGGSLLARSLKGVPCGENAGT